MIVQDVTSQSEIPAGTDETTLTISPEKLSFIIMKAQDVKDEVIGPNPESNPSDEQDAAVLEADLLKSAPSD